MIKSDKIKTMAKTVRQYSNQCMLPDNAHGVCSTFATIFDDPTYLDVSTEGRTQFFQSIFDSRKQLVKEAQVCYTVLIQQLV